MIQTKKYQQHERPTRSRYVKPRKGIKPPFSGSLYNKLFLRHSNKIDLIVRTKPLRDDGGYMGVFGGQKKRRLLCVRTQKRGGGLYKEEIGYVDLQFTDNGFTACLLPMVEAVHLARGSYAGGHVLTLGTCYFSDRSVSVLARDNKAG